MGSITEGLNGMGLSRTQQQAVVVAKDVQEDGGGETACVASLPPSYLATLAAATNPLLRQHFLGGFSRMLISLTPPILPLPQQPLYVVKSFSLPRV